MRIEILSDAEEDLIAGARFYERQVTGLGDYFLNSIYSDIDSLLIYGGIHRDSIPVSSLRFWRVIFKVALWNRVA
jgi:hypothetical protein